MDPIDPHASLSEMQAALASALARIEAFRVRERLLINEVATLRKKAYGPESPGPKLDVPKGPASPPPLPGAQVENVGQQSSLDLLKALSISSPTTEAAKPKDPLFTGLSTGAPLYVTSLNTSEQVVSVWLPGYRDTEKINCQIILSKDHFDFVQLRVRVKSEDFIGITSVKQAPSKTHGSGFLCCFAPTAMGDDEPPSAAPARPQTNLVDMGSGDEPGTPPVGGQSQRYRIYLRGRETQPIEFDASQTTREALHRLTERWLGQDAEAGGDGQATGPKPGEVVPPKHLNATHSMRLVGEPSQILTPQHVSCLASAVPPLERMRDWTLAYSTKVHGISLGTLYRKMHSGQVPTLLVIKDNSGYVFGCYTPEGWRINPRFYGSGETFVFQLEPARLMWPWQSRSPVKNDFFQYSTPDCLAVGGCGHFALHVDQELLQGSSGTCGTFGSPCLSGKEDFKVHHLEVWQVVL